MRWWALLSLLACGRDKSPDPAGDAHEISEVEDPGTSLDEDDTGGDSGATDDTGAAEDTGGGDDTGGEPAIDTRRFASKEVLATLVKDPNPFSSEDYGSQTTTSWKLLEWQRDGTAVTWTETLCDIESSEIFGTVTSFPAAFVAGVPVYSRTATLSAAETGADFSAGPHIDLLGVALDDPAGDALPTDPEDPAVIDQDADGQPGVTVHVDQEIMGEGDVYVVQRSTTTLSGVVVATDRVEGWIDAAPEQVVLSASAWWLELETESLPDPDSSWFIFQEVDESWGCAEILDAEASLF